MKQVIIHNRAKCAICDEVIESKHTHDFVSCRGGHISVDGGHDYLRRCFDKEENLIECSIYKEVMPENEIEQVLRGVAQECASYTDQPIQHSRLFERILRESGLLRLLEAGQQLRDYASSARVDAAEWDAALAALKEQAHA